MDNTIKIPQEMFSTSWWHKKRTYSEFEALLDLYHEQRIESSFRGMADRWRWQLTTTIKFLKRLQSDGWISIETNRTGTVISVVNTNGNPKPVQEQKCTPQPLCIKEFQETECTPKKENNTKRFKKPTVEEVTAYIKEKGYNFEAETFVDFYESKGWLVGKTPMKDWKAACRTWQRQEYGTKVDTKKKPKVSVGVLNFDEADMHDDRSERRYKSLMEMVEAVKANPKSFCLDALTNAYNSGELTRLGITWKP